MKLPGIAVATLAITALVGGTALAQVTMQPIPNPPEKPHAMHHGHGHKGRHHKGAHHHHMRAKHHARHHHHAKAKSDAAAPAAAPAQ